MGGVSGRGFKRGEECTCSYSVLRSSLLVISVELLSHMIFIMYM